MKSYVEHIQQGRTLTRTEMKEAVQHLFETTTDSADIQEFLLTLHERGETAEELAGAVDALMSRAVIYPQFDAALFDICGTGGDQSGSFNISTTAAFVVAGSGVKVAKHGNRSISSRSGSADVLAALGLAVSLSPSESASQLNESGLAFLFAPDIHPVMKQLQPIRKALAAPTLFNLIGPLANPYALSSQMIGVYRQDRQKVLAEAAHLLGRKRALIVTGEGHLDEAALDGTTRYTLLHDGSITTHTITASDVGLPSRQRNEIVGGEAYQNAEILRDVLKGKPSAYLDTTLLNAGLGLYAAGKVSSIQEGIHVAYESIESGRALEKLESYPRLVEVTS